MDMSIKIMHNVIMKLINKTISIRVSSDVIKELKSYGFNVSEICRQAMDEKLKKIKKVS